VVIITQGIILAKPVTFAQKTEHVWALFLWCFITTLMFVTSLLLIGRLVTYSSLAPRSYLMRFLLFPQRNFLTKKGILAPIKGKAKGLPHQVTDHERHKLAATAAASVDTLFGSVVVEQK